MLKGTQVILDTWYMYKNVINIDTIYRQYGFPQQFLILLEVLQNIIEKPEFNI